MSAHQPAEPLVVPPDARIPWRDPPPLVVEFEVIPEPTGDPSLVATVRIGQWTGRGGLNPYRVGVVVPLAVRQTMEVYAAQLAVTDLLGKLRHTE